MSSQYFVIPDKEFFSLEDLASILNVSRSHVYRMAQEGAIKSLRVGNKRLLIPKASLDEYIDKLEGTPAYAGREVL